MDVIAVLLEFCDGASLSALARVSYAFLQVVARHLYTTVTISTLDQLNKLFCARVRGIISPLNLASPVDSRLPAGLASRILAVLALGSIRLSRLTTSNLQLST